KLSVTFFHHKYSYHRLPLTTRFNFIITGIPKSVTPKPLYGKITGLNLLARYSHLLFYSNTNSKSPEFTWSPLATSNSFTTALRGAFKVVSIFMASEINSN